MKSIASKIKVLLLVGIFTAVGAISLTAKANVWTTENQWSSEWEQKYKNWLRDSTDSHLFSRAVNKDGSPNPYYGIRVDCADLVYSLRIIFSYENKLPFVIHNPVSSRVELISNDIKRYDKFSEGIPRLKVFLTWIYDLVSTHSMPLDTYSIPFEAVGPGTLILTTHKNHHSWTIRDITKTGNPDLLFNSTVGRLSGLEVQERLSWPNPAWIFEPEVDKNDETKNINIYLPGSYAGFRYWRPVDYMNKPESVVPGYSEEQHKVGVSKWKTGAISKLAKVKESVDQVVLRLLKDACSDFQQRVTAVAEAEVAKAELALLKTKNDSTGDANQDESSVCLDAEKFDQYSTPSRDRRFVDGLIQARVYFQDELARSGEKAFSSANLSIYTTIFPFITKSAAEEASLDKTAKSAQNYCSLTINSKIGNLSLAELKRRVFLGKVSANPNDSTTGRFGYSKTEKDIGYTKCQEKTYGLGPSIYNLNKIESDAKKEILSSKP
ncbi:MAG: hypothetical protein WA160_07710 [Pseudobdellovibrio sp.]